MRAFAAATLSLLLVACTQAPAAALPPVAMTPASDTVPAEPVVEEVRSATATIVAPTLVAAREAVQAVVAPPPADVTKHVMPAAAGPRLSSVGLAHLVRWEIGSVQRYDRLYRAPIWPQGSSGITWCIGYDGGHQTARTIHDDWAQHPAVERLATTAGLTGSAARAALPRYRDITTPFPYCQDVFLSASVPAYMRSTTRAYADDMFAHPQGVVDALFGNTYNRGGSMVGSRNVEKRRIRDECLPDSDYACLAAQLRAQCRLWIGTSLEAGLCARRESEAALVEVSR
ncbi:hypothetical protein [uncultured Luteimonas sp.]|uniref:hypothetical protein n=1 Tax=uncultured Luteimonas sp. TaxID=453144 RepID=UPI00262D5BB8|nr:hypothetical protein [uncultured Luteimonas sp.]